MNRPIPYSKQDITEEDVELVVKVLHSELLTQGPQLKVFEENFASYVGSKYAVAVSSGTAALHLAAMSLNVDSKTSVICTPFTFVASTNCILYCGGQVKFVDIDPDTYILDIEKVTVLLESAPKGTFHGIVVVDYAGFPADMESWKKLADKYDLWIIEDACHALGGSFVDSRGQEQKCGNGKYADIGVFSFHPVKHITTGEGGMITTNRKDLYDKLLILRSHGITKNPDKMIENHGGWYYEMQDLGYNYRLSEIAAALGSSQLKRIDSNIKKREEIASRYDKEFENLGIVKSRIPLGYKHAYHLYVIQTEKRKELYDFLKSKNIHVQVHYIPVYLHPYYKKLGLKNDDFLVTENVYETCLSLPMYPSLTEADQIYVIETIMDFFKIGR